MRNTKRIPSTQEPPTIASLVQMRIDNLSVRRILEILVPVRIFVEIDEFGHAHLLGATNWEGHFQVGTLVNLKEWTPTQDQGDIRWQQIEEPGYVLHIVERRPRLRKTDMEVALIQHHASPNSDTVDIVTVTPLWDKREPLSPQDATVYQARCSYTCGLMLQCSCPQYVSMRQAYWAQYQ